MPGRDGVSLAGESGVDGGRLRTASQPAAESARAWDDGLHIRRNDETIGGYIRPVAVQGLTPGHL
jgi:hypothetical protein